MMTNEAARNDLGASAVEILPIETGGVAHIRALKGPIPSIALVPYGSIDACSDVALLSADAKAGCVGSAVASAKALSGGDSADIADAASRDVNAVRGQGLSGTGEG